MTVEKEEKPQKLYEVKLHIWDDGEIQADMVEIVRQDRGAPKKWMLERADFQRSLKSQLSTTPQLIGDEISALLGFKARNVKSVELSKEETEDLEDAIDDFDVE